MYDTWTGEGSPASWKGRRIHWRSTLDFAPRSPLTDASVRTFKLDRLTHPTLRPVVVLKEPHREATHGQTLRQAHAPRVVVAVTGVKLVPLRIG